MVEQVLYLKNSSNIAYRTNTEIESAFYFSYVDDETEASL